VCVCECVCEDMHGVCSFGVQAKDTQFPKNVLLLDYSMMGSQPIITLYSKVQFNEGPCPLIQLQYHRARVMPEQPLAGQFTVGDGCSGHKIRQEQLSP